MMSSSNKSFDEVIKVPMRSSKNFNENGHLFIRIFEVMKYINRSALVTCFHLIVNVYPMAGLTCETVPKGEIWVKTRMSETFVRSGVIFGVLIQVDSS